MCRYPVSRKNAAWPLNISFDGTLGPTVDDKFRLSIRMPLSRLHRQKHQEGGMFLRRIHHLLFTFMRELVSWVVAATSRKSNRGSLTGQDQIKPLLLLTIGQQMDEP